MMGRSFTLPPLAMALLLLPVAAIAGACDADPVHTAAVTALGPEVAGIPKGEYHRAGQPCVTCHGGEGPASTQFVIAGTVFYGPANSSNTPPIGVGDVNVLLEDDSGSQFQVTTDCVGNFFIKPGDWPGGGTPRSRCSSPSRASPRRRTSRPRCRATSGATARAPTATSTPRSSTTSRRLGSSTSPPPTTPTSRAPTRTAR